MVTTIRLDVTKDQAEHLGLLLNGKKKSATRKQIVEWGKGKLQAYLNGKGTNGRTEIKGFVCPKCSKPIALEVPSGKVERTPRQSKAMERTRESAEALASALTELVEVLT